MKTYRGGLTSSGRAWRGKVLSANERGWLSIRSSYNPDNPDHRAARGRYDRVSSIKLKLERWMRGGFGL